MDDITIIDKLRKRMKATKESLSEAMLAGAVDNMEKYRYMLGQAHAYEIILQEISNLLKPKEQKDEQGNVIDIGQGSTKIKLGLEAKYEEENLLQSIDAKEPLTPENIGSETVDELPEPSGYRILVLPFTPKEKTKGGILFSQESLDKARIATTCGYVLKMGNLAYQDKEKFGEPWCKKGDWVIFARYAGSRLPIEGGEVRILNDDEVLGTVSDPESILHLI